MQGTKVLGAAVLLLFCIGFWLFAASNGHVDYINLRPDILLVFATLVLAASLWGSLAEKLHPNACTAEGATDATRVPLTVRQPLSSSASHV